MDYVLNTSEQFRHESECREWLARIRAKKPRTEDAGKQILNELIAEIAKKRGQVVADHLKAGIEAARNQPAKEIK